LPEPDLNPDKITYLAFTSGTTGMPKGVLHSDNTLLANGRAMVKDWHHDDQTILFSHSPLSHHIGTVAIEQSLVAGFEVVVNDLPAGKKPLDWIVETGATYVMGVPTHAMDILSDMKSRGMKKLGNVGIFYMAGSIIPPQTAKSFLDMGIKPQNIYGMTENGSHQYTLPDDDVEVITTTCGRACHGYETRLWDQENPDIEAKPGELGEIGTRGALLTLGYFNNQSATENSFNASGWFLSGDLGRLDAKGNLQIVGRKKDLIIRGGHNIYPAHIENLTVKHPAVLKAAAFPIADERLGERVCLAIIARDGTRLDAVQMLDHLGEHGLSTTVWCIRCSGRSLAFGKSVRLLFARAIALRGYIPREITVPDDRTIDCLIETEPAINDDTTKKQAKYDSFYTDSERELKRKARETRS
jgi:acyl-CoA synthetase